MSTFPVVGLVSEYTRKNPYTSKVHLEGLASGFKNGIYVLCKRYELNIMQLQNILWGALLLIFIPALSPAENFTLDEVVFRIQKTYQGIDNIHANFRQKSISALPRHQQIFSGKLFIKKPNLVRMDIVCPQKQRIIINNKEVWVYIPDENQAIASAVPPELRTIFSFLMGKEIDERYQISFARPALKENEGNYLLRVEEKADPKVKFDNIILEVRKKDFYIIQASLFDFSEGGVQLELNKIRVNKKLDNNFFTFVPPKGTEVQRVGD